MQERILTETSTLQVLLVSDFNLANFEVLLSKSDETPRLAAQSAPFGQVTQTLLQKDEQLWKGIDAAIIWTQPSSISSSHRALVANQEVDPEAILQEVDQFSQAIKRIPSTVRHIFVPTWISAPFDGRLGLLDMDATKGVSRALLGMNSRLVDNLSQERRVFVLDASRWLAVHGQKAFDSRLWYMSKTPFSAAFFKEAASDIRAAVSALSGQTRKLVVLDLDDTLWGGIVGDVGWPNLRLGGHDGLGEAFVDFQRAVKNLTRRG